MRLFAGTQAPGPAAPIGSASPKPTQDHRFGIRDRNERAGSLTPTHAKMSNTQNARTGSHAKLDADAKPTDLKSAGTAVGCVGASPDRHVAGENLVCAACGITAEKAQNRKLLECGACQSVRYCGKACQKADWPAHNPTFNRLQALRQ
jgi:hypothetical protein